MKRWLNLIDKLAVALRDGSPNGGQMTYMHRGENQVVPQEGARYRASLPIMVLAFHGNHQAAITIESGEVLEVIGPDRDDRFTIIAAHGEQFLVFESDLKDRGELISAAHSC